MSILLRPYRYNDAGNLALYANNPRIAANVRDSFPSPYTLEDARKWIDFCVYGQSADTHLSRAIVQDDQLVGGIGVVRQKDVYRYSAEIGYWLAEPFWGRGLVTEAIREFTAEAFSVFDIQRLYAGVFSFNRSSMRVLEKAGYALEAIHQQAIFKEGTFWDEHLYVKFRT
ncbi:GNAT family N-acetyltransferase [Telluribacter sp.]|jgi:RimJ/RimL family protein N-acetyltransferase|uniref:GNAT family N-acetyltransferase n=1 Tax=Telluribacter sp. TaxID=1978767 RepID=UPI002E13605F|nr:GNAT family N-acetyltransferase [Telluribacter sp.]